MSAAPADFTSRFSAETPYSYLCHRCRHCCHHKLIQVNPYEAARLARNRGVSTTVFIRDYLENSVYLRRLGDGACVFLGPQGCTVHPDRPLVCRVYPLGRHVEASGAVTYSHLEPHPQTQGVYGQAGTVADYLVQQDVAEFVAAADHYLAILQRLYSAWRRAQVAPEAGEPAPQSPGGELPDLMDLDRVVADSCARRGIAEPTGIDERMRLHLEAITRWLERNSGDEAPPSR
jgi:hypothetical protein